MVHTICTCMYKSNFITVSFSAYIILLASDRHLEKWNWWTDNVGIANIFFMCKWPGSLLNRTRWMQYIVERAWASRMLYCCCIGSITGSHNMLDVCLSVYAQRRERSANSCSRSQGRVLSPIHFVDLFCIRSAVSAAHWTPSCSLLCHSLPSSSCEGLSAPLEVFRVSGFTTSSETTVIWRKGYHKSV